MAKEKKVTKFLELLDLEEVTKLYKHFSGVTVVKFKDREDAEQRLITASFGKTSHVMIEAMKKVGISKNVYEQYGTMLRGPIAFPEGRMNAKQLKAHKEALAAGKKIDEKQQDGKQPNAVAASVLRAMREVIAPGAEGEAAQTDSTVVAEKLGTNVNAVIKAGEQLVKLDLIGMEDDTPEGKDASPYYELWLTDKGRSFELKAPSGKPPVKLPGSHSGPRSGFGGKLIYPLVTGNPRRPGSIGHHSFSLIKPGMTFEEYKKAGGRNTDLAWDIDHGFTVVLSPGEPAPKPGSAPASSPAPQPPKKTEKAAPKEPKEKKPSPEDEIRMLREKLAAMEAAQGKKEEEPKPQPKKAAPAKKAVAAKGKKGKKK
jgi:hypothetical protein